MDLPTSPHAGFTGPSTSSFGLRHSCAGASEKSDLFPFSTSGFSDNTLKRNKTSKSHLQMKKIKLGSPKSVVFRLYPHTEHVVTSNFDLSACLVASVNPEIQEMLVDKHHIGNPPLSTYLTMVELLTA